MNFKSTYQRISLMLVPFSLLIQCFQLWAVCLHLQATSQQLLAEVLKELGKKLVSVLAGNLMGHQLLHFLNTGNSGRSQHYIHIRNYPFTYVQHYIIILTVVSIQG
jgi:hypothetical protein